MSFDVASVKPSLGWRTPVFALNSDDAKRPGGRFYATFPLQTFIQFAYKLAPFQTADALASAPKWLSTDEYDIEAEAPGNLIDLQPTAERVVPAQNRMPKSEVEIRVAPCFHRVTGPIVYYYPER